MREAVSKRLIQVKNIKSPSPGDTEGIPAPHIKIAGESKGYWFILQSTGENPVPAATPAEMGVLAEKGEVCAKP
ncbi:MAG: hypothetical protein EOP86_15185 [Verrucomicrobiaceae bacterium]|nr:MAG: hypothetical protein EOP86_15185 [Verrucomicrobiaceae bacterium]